jgi:predicted metal-dependent hydrolase
MEALWSGSIDEWTEDAAATRQPTPRPTRIVPPEPTPAIEAGVATMEVEVVRSSKRRKSVSARIVDGRIVVRMPQWMSKAQEAEYVTSLVAKLERQNTAQTIDLPRPESIRWVANQQQRWGSCTPSTSEIRISDRIAGFPDWVVDAVIVHELAHLVHLHHTDKFWALANRYPKTERAYGFLIAKHLTDDDVEPG